MQEIQSTRKQTKTWQIVKQYEIQKSRFVDYRSRSHIGKSAFTLALSRMERGFLYSRFTKQRPHANLRPCFEGGHVRTLNPKTAVHTWQPMAKRAIFLVLEQLPMLVTRSPAINRQQFAANYEFAAWPKFLTIAILPAKWVTCET